MSGPQAAPKHKTEPSVHTDPLTHPPTHPSPPGDDVKPFYADARLVSAVSRRAEEMEEGAGALPADATDPAVAAADAGGCCAVQAALWLGLMHTAVALPSGQPSPDLAT